MSVPSEPSSTSAPPSRRRTGLGEALLALVALGLALGMVELAMRVVFPRGLELSMESSFPWLVRQPAFGWTNRAGYRNESFSINQHSLRGPSFAIAKPEGTIRVVCLGDSRTFGIWLDRGGLRFDNDWPRLLQERLAAERAFPVEVLNLGVIGYTTAHGLRQLMTRLPRFEPDVLILAMGMNDHVPSWNPGLRARTPESPLLAGALSWTWNWRLVQLALAASMGLGQPDPFTVPWVEPSEYSDNLGRIVRVADRLGIRLLFFHQGLRPLEMGEDLPAFPGVAPNSLELLGATTLADLHRQHGAYRQRLGEVALRENVPLVDGATFLGEGGRPPAFGPYDLVHANARGAAQVAEALHLRLRELGWL